MEDAHISWEIRERHQTAKCLPDGNPTFMTDYPRWFKHQTWSPAVKSRGKWSRPGPSLPCNPQWRGLDFFRVGTCLLDAAGSRSQPFADVRSTTVVKAEWQKWSLLEVSNVAQRRFVWQAWHFVTFQQLEMCFPQQWRTFFRHPKTSKMVQDFLVALYLAYVPTCYLLRLLRFYPLVN